MLSRLFRKLATLLVLILSCITFFQNRALCLTLPELWELEKVDFMGGIEVSTLQIMSQHHVIFIGGFLSELDLAGLFYFTDNKSSVQNELNSTFTHISSYSARSILTNTEGIHSKIIKEYQKVKKPLIIVAHSKGAAEIYSVLQKYPELIFNNVVSVAILIQGAIGGTPFAHFHNCGFAIRSFHYLWGEGFQSLAPEQRHIDNESLFKTFEDGFQNTTNIQPLNLNTPIIDRKNFSNRIIFSPSYEEPAGFCFGIKIFRWFCYADNCLKGKNDGFLTLEDQRSDRLGISLDPVRADHSGLVLSLPNRLTSHDRRAYTRAVFQKALEILRESQ